MASAVSESIDLSIPDDLVLSDMSGEIYKTLKRTGRPFDLLNLLVNVSLATGSLHAQYEARGLVPTELGEVKAALADINRIHRLITARTISTQSLVRSIIGDLSQFSANEG